MSGYFFGFGLARPIFFAALLALIPIFLWQRRRLTHFSGIVQTLLLGLRCAVVVLLVGALIGPQRVEENFRKFVVFCVDQSGSLPAGGYSQSESYIQSALKNRGENEFAVLPFAGHPGAIGRSVLKPTDDDKSPLAPLNPDRTDFAKSTVLAEAAAPEDYVGEVVLLSDFLAAKSESNEAKTINPFKVEAFRVDIGSKEPQPEICIDRIAVPATVRKGQTIPVEVLVQSNVAQSVDIRLTSVPDQIFAPQTVAFAQPGVQSVLFEAPASVEGPVQFQAALVGSGAQNGSGSSNGPAIDEESVLPLENDTLSANNRYRSSTTVLPQGQILLVENRKNLAQPLSKALAGEFLSLVSCTANEFPADLSEFEAVVLSNIPATALPDSALARLERYVEQGGGLIAAGGDQSFTAGGWHGTTLEKLMPVDCVVQPNQPRPALALVLVIDRSESMVNNSDNPALTAMELAKEAARRAVNVLTAQDQLGVLTFEDNFAWNVALSPCADKSAILEQIDKIQAAGRTNLYPALENAYLSLAESFAQRKHIIVLTDGISQPGNFEALSRRIAASGITLSTVAVGEEGDCPVLSDMARNCQGKRYVCKDPAQLPTIFALETASAAKMGVIERTTKLRPAGTLSALGPWDAAKSPSLLGYVQTQIKPGAFALYNAPAVTDSEGQSIADPILAWQRYGQNGGIVAAFTSDVESRWSRAWQRWEGFGPFWARLINHARRPDPADLFSVSIERRRVVVSGRLTDPPCSCRLARVDGPESAEASAAFVSATETAPGYFTAVVPEFGTYRIQMIQNGAVVWETVRMFVDNYTDEYRLDRSEKLAVSALPKEIGAENVFDKSNVSVLKTYRYWQWLLLLGLCLTVAEVVVRRSGVA